MGTFELKMPKLGESVTEGTIGKWLKQPGDAVEKYDLIVEVQTDKVNTEIPSPVAGTLKEVKVAEGDTVPIGALLATFETAEAAVAAAPPSSEGASAQVPAAVPPGSSPAPSAQQSGASVPRAQIPAAPPPAPAPEGKGTPPPAPAPEKEETTVAAPLAGVDVRATPAVRKLASENKVDLSQISGTGLGGRVSKQDVEQYIASRGQSGAAAAAPASAKAPAPAAPAREPMVGDEAVPLTPMRKAIATAMVTSKTTIPHAAAIMEIDWTNVAKFRAKVKDDFKAREGFELTYLPFAMKAVILALRNNPLVNATWTQTGVTKLKNIGLGVAISLDDEGLVVPVIKNAEDLSITGLAKAVRDLATRARSKKLTLADFEGGTFTVNNGGTLGTYLSYPIVNPGQAAIMTTEAIGKRVVVLEDDAIAIRTMGNVVLSFDHRIMDGATAARFLRDVKSWIQNVDAGNVALS
ncbi:MAG TPA: dihydrolipoamide acetyltransferase family protein [Candidatus Limnocylindria bacterium]|jgi:pyruvate dehydrogenase complex dihydrolipoamide acetyltransferase long form